MLFCFVFFFQAEDGIRDGHVTGVQTCALPISMSCACRSLDIVAWPRGAISKTRSMWMRVWTSNSVSDAEYVICPGCGELAETGVSDRDSRSGRSDSSDDSSETLIVMSRKGPGTADGRSKPIALRFAGSGKRPRIQGNSWRRCEATRGSARTMYVAGGRAWRMRTPRLESSCSHE